MNLYRLALRNITGSAFRSWVVALCALLVAGFTLATTLLVSGTETSMRLALARLGRGYCGGADGLGGQGRERPADGGYNAHLDARVERG